MGYVFDGATKTITLTAGTTVVGVRDVWSRAVDWWLTSDNSKWQFPFVQVGGNPIDVSAGTSIPIYAFLQGAWRIKPQESDHTLVVNDGILLVDGGGDPFVDTLGDYTVRINYQQPVQAITVSTGGGAAPSASQIADAVWDEIASEHLTSGTTGRKLREIIANLNAIKGLS